VKLVCHTTSISFNFLTSETLSIPSQWRGGLRRGSAPAGLLEFIYLSNDLASKSFYHLL
jgi:hypothetical protein